MENVAQNCKNCGSALSGRYCHHCGQKDIKPEDKKIKHFLEELIASLFFADGKFFKTFRVLFSKPGELSHSYISGARQKYLSPLQLFFFANLLYFLFPFLSTFNTNLSTQIKHLPYSPWVKEVVQNHLDSENLDYLEFRENYEQKSGQIAKLLLVILVFLQSGAMSLLFLNRKTLFFSDYLAVSAYFTSFYILVLLIIVPGIINFVDEYITDGITGLININETVISISFTIIIISFLSVFLKRAFEIGRKEALWKSLVLALLLIPSFMIYRFILFWVTFLMVR